MIGQQKGKAFVQEANLMNAFYLLVHNLNAGDYHFSWSPHRGVEIMGETVFL